MTDITSTTSTPATPAVLTTTAGPMPALYTAMARAQSEFPAIAKNRLSVFPGRTRGDKGSTYAYADLEEILSKTRGPLTKHGLMLIVRKQAVSGTEVLLQAVLAHLEGGTITSEVIIPGPVGADSSQDYGAMVTYVRRSMIQALLNVAADDDLDAKAADDAGANASDATGIPAELLHAAQAAAAQGSVAYQRHFGALPLEDRQRLKPESRALKAAATEADKRATRAQAGGAS